MKENLKRLLMHKDLYLRTFFISPAYTIVHASVIREGFTLWESIGIAQKSELDKYDKNRGFEIARARALQSLWNQMFPEDERKAHVYRRL